MQSTRTEIPAGRDAVTFAERCILLALAGTPRAQEAAALAATMVTEEIQASGGSLVALAVDLDIGWCRITIERSGAGDGVLGSAWIAAAGLTADRVGHRLAEAGEAVWFELGWSVE